MSPPQPTGRRPTGRCLFVSDLHGSIAKLGVLLEATRREAPDIVFLGGDLLPFGGRLAAGAAASVAASGPESGRPAPGGGSFLLGPLTDALRALRGEMGEHYPLLAVILGNDDPRREESALREGEREGLWRYLHDRRLRRGGYTLYGYSFVPPTPFLLKDWERYDVSRFVDVGAVPPTAGWRSVPIPRDEAEHATIREDLERLAGGRRLDRAVFLFHAPPYGSALDLADLEGQMVDHAPLDVHIGSIAVRRFIEQRQPYLTLHGHAHESARLSGSWRERIGDTWCFSAAHDGPELAVVRFTLGDLATAERTLL